MLLGLGVLNGSFGLRGHTQLHPENIHTTMFRSYTWEEVHVA